MVELLGNLLIQEEDIKSSIRKRGKTYIEKTIEGRNHEILEQKALLEEDDGWIILRKNKKSFRLKKDNPLSEQLEDKIWTIVARMGFDELSNGRDFTISVGDGLNPRQIDVFAKDKETAILIECTSCEKPQKKNMSNLIEKIESISNKVFKSINSHYGCKPTLKLKWVIATKNIEWGKTDLEKAKVARIHVLRDSEIDYYSKLTNHLKIAAKYQFLSHLFSNETIKALDITVPATRGKMGGVTFYNFLIKPSELIKIAYISHKASRDIEDLETYQRMLSPKRLKDIASYIDSGGQFPTNIVVNIKSNKNIRFDIKNKIGDSAFGTLYLPNAYSSCWIIDGQHRLYGYMHSDQAKNPNDKTTLPVLAYDKISSVDEATLFVDINCKQVRVTRRLLNELYSNLTWDSENFDERINALCSRVVTALNSRNTSPIYDRIILTNKDKTKFRCLTLTSFNDGLKENRFFGYENKPGSFTDSKTKNLEDTKNKTIEILSGYFTFFSIAMPGHWKLGDDKGGYLCTNNGIRALLMVLREILSYIVYIHKIELDICNAIDLLPYIKKYIQPVIDFFLNTTEEDITLYRSRQALKGVRKNSLIMMSLINKIYEDFLPQGLKEYLDTVDIEGTDVAHKMIDDIQNRLFKIVMSKLRKHFGDNWWYDGVPQKIRTDCSQRQEEEKGIKNKEQYLHLIDYKKIALSNWELFKENFSFLKKGGKIKQLEWVDGLNTIRNITHHREKWPVTKEQVKYVREIYNKVMEHFVIDEED